MYHKRRRQGSQKGPQRKRFKGDPTKRLSDLPAGSARSSSRALRPYQRYAASQVIVRQPSGFPDRLYTKLVYREQLSFSQLTGLLGENVYRGNSAFDPDQTGAGGQPMAYDNYAGLYQYYTVLASGIEVIADVNNTGVRNVTIGITPCNVSTGFGTTGQELAMEQPYSKFKQLLMGSDGTGQATLKHYMCTNKIFGVKRAAIEIEDGYSAAVSTNPSNSWYWHVWNFVPGGATQSLIVQVVLTYYCVFEQRQTLSVS